MRKRQFWEILVPRLSFSPSRSPRVSGHAMIIKTMVCAPHPAPGPSKADKCDKECRGYKERTEQEDIRRVYEAQDSIVWSDIQRLSLEEDPSV